MPTAEFPAIPESAVRNCKRMAMRDSGALRALTLIFLRSGPGKPKKGQVASRFATRIWGVFVNSECFSWKNKENSQTPKFVIRELHRFLWILLFFSSLQEMLRIHENTPDSRTGLRISLSLAWFAGATPDFWECDLLLELQVLELLLQQRCLQQALKSSAHPEDESRTCHHCNATCRTESSSQKGLQSTPPRLPTELPNIISAI